MAGSRKQYPFHLIEPKWQQAWDEQQAFRAFNPGDVIPELHPFGARHNLSGKTASAGSLPPKFYILDMFPYPSGAGLHVGHPEGYTATDILARYRRACGFNVLHPMGWDSFGLPAEQYAVKTGQHPRKTTDENIANFTRQIKSLGFSYDWSRELATTDPDYFKWTQWIFLKLYNSWFNPETNKAEPISILEDAFSENPKNPSAWADSAYLTSIRELIFTEATVEDRKRIRTEFVAAKRLAYVSEAPVNWCPELGTVLANEEVIDGKSEVGGFPVIRKPMRQWMLRITAYAERLLVDLDTIDWSDSLKEMQRNWIGRSEGAEVDFQIAGSSEKIRVFTTRPDTLFGATYMVLSPEHRLLQRIIPSNWPKDTPYYWQGQLYADKNRTDVLKTSKHDISWHGQSAPTPLLTREQAVQKAKELGLETISLEQWRPEKELIEAVPWHFVRHYRVVPLEISPSLITLATDSPTDITSFDAVGFILGKEVRLKVTSTQDLEAAQQLIPQSDQLLSELYFDSPQESVEKYRKYAASKSDLERTELAKEKTGVFTGAYAINPVNSERIPIWIADYVLASYGTGAIMAVPAHDERDWEFAKKFSLGIRQVVDPKPIDVASVLYGSSPKAEGSPTNPERCFTGDGVAVNSSNSEISLNGLHTTEAKKKITGWLEEKGLGKKTINYKLRDWLFSRQRYWGEPFPIVWKKDTDGNLYHEALPESSLPLLPPSLEDYKPTPDGQPPLARAKDWVNLPDGSVRETNTMPQWAGSCWYYLRYLDAKNAGAFVGKEAESYWMAGDSVAANVSSRHTDVSRAFTSTATKPGVDLYVGGTEHAVLHLLYARFWHKVLFDLGYVSTPEPFFKLVNQGLILGEDGQKMSKSRGNVVNPDDVLKEFGADAFRLYEMFMGPLQDTKPWNTRGVEGVYRFLGRVWRLFVDEQSETEFEQAETTTKEPSNQELLNLIKLDIAIKDVAATPVQMKALHACIKKVTEDLDGMRFNTAISAMMVFVNDAMTWETKPVSALKTFLQLLAPFAPHLAEELWAKLHSSFAIHHLSLPYEPWPKFDPALLVESTLQIPVQVDGKMRNTIYVPAGSGERVYVQAALQDAKVQQFLVGREIKKTIVIPNKMVSIVSGVAPQASGQT